jgi:hypothetical protein
MLMDRSAVTSIALAEFTRQLFVECHFGQKVHDPRQAQLACAAADISAEDSQLALWPD